MSTTQPQPAAATPAAARVEPLIRVEGVGRRYRVGDNVVVALADVSFEVRRRGVRRRARPVGVRQDDAAEHDRRARLADRGAGRRGRARHHARLAQGAVRVPPPRRQLRLPDLQPLPGADGAGERGVRRRRRRPPGSDRGRRRDARARRSRRPAAALPARAVRRRAAARGDRAGARLAATRRCWPTSRPASSTSAPASRSSSCCTRRRTPAAPWSS